MVTLRVTFAVPGSLDTPTGGYAYGKRIVTELRRRDCDVEVLDLGPDFPAPASAARAAAIAALTAVPADRVLIVDGLAFGVLPEAAAALRRTHRVIALVHHPLAFENGLAPARAAMLHASEREVLACATQVLVTSAATARLLQDAYGVEEKRITVARPGTDRVATAPSSVSPAPGEPVRLLSVGSLVPRKGHDLLLQALAGLTRLAWHLTIVGDDKRDRATARALAAQAADLGLSGRVVFTGAATADGVAHCYAAAHVFVLATRFEGYGMAFAEAIGHGLPVVGSSVMAVPEIVPPSAGILVPPGDPAALQAALRTMLADVAARTRYAAGARAAAAQLPDWDGAADAVLALIRGAM